MPLLLVVVRSRRERITPCGVAFRVRLARSGCQTEFVPQPRKAHLGEPLDPVQTAGDKALALERYAQQAMNTDAERQACEIRIRAERRCGEMLPDVLEHGGDRKSESRSHDATLNKLGISKQQSSRWQKLADIPDKQFERDLTGDEKLSTTGLLRKANGSADKMNPSALWMCRRLHTVQAAGEMSISRQDLHPAAAHLR